MKYLLSFAVLTITFILLAPPLINGAPTPSQGLSQSSQAPEQVNKTLREGLNVMLKVMLNFFPSTRIRVRNRTVENRVCQVVEYISQVVSASRAGAANGNSSHNGEVAQNETTFFSKNETLAAAEKIQNDTCNWVNAIRKSTKIIPTCSTEGLQHLCLYIRIFEAVRQAITATTTVVDVLDEGQWINTRFSQDSPVRQKLCSLFHCPMN